MWTYSVRVHDYAEMRKYPPSLLRICWTTSVFARLLVCLFDRLSLISDAFAGYINPASLTSNELMILLLLSPHSSSSPLVLQQYQTKGWIELSRV